MMLEADVGGVGICSNNVRPEGPATWGRLLQLDSGLSTALGLQALEAMYSIDEAMIRVGDSSGPG